jgi:hypothetical protein
MRSCRSCSAADDPDAAEEPFAELPSVRQDGCSALEAVVFTEAREVLTPDETRPSGLPHNRACLPSAEKQ